MTHAALGIDKKSKLRTKISNNRLAHATSSDDVERLTSTSRDESFVNNVKLILMLDNAREVSDSFFCEQLNSPLCTSTKSLRAASDPEATMSVIQKTRLHLIHKSPTTQLESPPPLWGL